MNAQSHCGDEPPKRRLAASDARLSRRFIEACGPEGALRPGERVLAAVSGGSDSVALLELLHACAAPLDIRLTVAHLDHCLRGAESREDAAFVRNLATHLGLPFHAGRADVRGRARRGHVSLEMAARSARHDFFRRALRACTCDVVALAHTADDQAETVFLRLLRGAGPGSLAGMRPRAIVGGIHIARPLLDFTRAELRAFLHARGLTWREDATNLDLNVPRNRVRHEVFPLIESHLQPRLREGLARAAALSADEEDWLEALTRESLRSCLDADRLRLDPLRALHPAARRRVLRLWLRDHAAAAPDALGTDALFRIERHLAARDHRERIVPLPGGLRVICSHSVLRVDTDRGTKRQISTLAGDRPFARVRLRRPGEMPAWPGGPWVRVWRAREIVREPGVVGVLPSRVSLSPAAVGRRALYLRTWRPGDRIQPVGMRGSRKLQDVFVDAGVPRELRGRVPVLECGGEVVWVAGYRVARDWAVQDTDGWAWQVCVSETRTMTEHGCRTRIRT